MFDRLKHLLSTGVSTIGKDLNAGTDTLINRFIGNNAPTTPVFTSRVNPGLQVQAQANNESPLASFKQGFKENLQNPAAIPDIQAKTTIGKVASFVPNLAIGTVNSVVGQGIVNPTLDVAQNIARTVQGKAPLDYSQLRSAPSRLGYQVAGLVPANSDITKTLNTPMNTSETIGNVAGTALPIAGAYTGGAAVESQLAKDTLQNRLLNGALSGAKFGGTYGGLSGLDQARGQNLADQLKSGVIGGVTGAAGGAALGAAFPLAGEGLKRTINAVKETRAATVASPNLKPGFSPGFAKVPGGTPAPVPEVIPPETTTPVDANFLRDRKTATDNYRSIGFTRPGDIQPANAGLQKIEQQFNTPTGKLVAQQELKDALARNNITPNPDGTITVYRAGNPVGPNNLTSVSLSKDAAAQFGTPVEYRIKPTDVALGKGVDPAELVVAKSGLQNVPDLTGVSPVPTATPVSPTPPQQPVPVPIPKISGPIDNSLNTPFDATLPQNQPKVDSSLISSAKGIGDGTVPMQKSGFSNALNEARGLFSTGPGTTDVQNSLRANRGLYDLNKGNLARNSESAVKGWNKLTPEDHVKFINNIETGTPQANPELQALDAQYRARFEQDFQLAQSLKPDLPHMENYFAQSGIWADPKAAETFANRWTTRSLAGTPGALEQRTIPTIMDGINAGLKLKETNPEIIALNSRTQLLKAKMAQDFTDQQLAKGVPQDKINAVLDKYLSTGIGSSHLYRTVREANGALNTLELSLSGFHVLGTSINASASKAALAVNDLLTGHPVDALKHVLQTPTATLEYLFKGGKILKDVKAGNLTPDIANIAGGGGKFKTPDIYNGTGFQDALNTMQKEGWQNKLKGGLQVIPATLRAVSAPIMEQWVPRLKAGAAADLIASNLSRLPANATPEMINAVRADAINSIDNRFGQLNLDNVFWNKTFKDLLSLGTRSPGWNIGTIRELGGGVKDLGGLKQLFSGGGISNRAAYTATLPIMVGMLGATYQYLKTGQGPQEIKDYFYPKTGQIDPKTGNPERVSFPTYAKDVYSFITNPVQTAKNKLSPILNTASNIINNKDYYGNTIVDPFASNLDKARQVGKYIGTQAVPFSITGGVKRVNPNLETSVESFAGITKAPSAIQNPGQTDFYNAQTELQNLQTQFSSTAKKVASGDLTQQQGDQQLKDIQARIDNANAIINKGLPNVPGSNPPENLAAAKTINLPGGKLGYVDASGTLHKNINQDQANVLAAKDQLTSGDNYQTLSAGGKVYAKIGDSINAYTTQAKADLAIAKDQFAGSDQNYAQSPDGQYVFRKDASGNVTQQTKVAFTTQLQTAELASLKRNNNLKDWLTTANAQANNIQTQLQDPNVDALDKIQLQNTLDSLMAEADKYTTYGGFTKPKAAKSFSGSGSSNSLVSSTYKNLQSLLGGTAKAPSAMPQGQKVQLKKYIIKKG